MYDLMNRKIPDSASIFAQDLLAVHESCVGDSLQDRTHLHYHNMLYSIASSHTRRSL